MLESPAGKLKGVPSVSATQVKNHILRGEGKGLHEKVHFFAGYFRVSNHISIGLEIERSEEMSPPIGPNIFFQVLYWTQRAQNTGTTVPRTDRSTMLTGFLLHGQSLQKKCLRKIISRLVAEVYNNLIKRKQKRGTPASRPLRGSLGSLHHNPSPEQLESGQKHFYIEAQEVIWK